MMENSGHGLTITQMMKLLDEADYISEREKIEAKLKWLYGYVKWTDDNFEEYKLLLDKLRTKKNNTKEIGAALEDVVSFIFEKSIIYDVYKDQRTGTNEIDHFVVLNNHGKQALHEYSISKELLITKQDYFVCECKNYKETVSATWVGKFNTLLEVSGQCEVGIIFSYEGLSGEENKWYASHGLTKIIYRISDENKKRFIIDINYNDLEELYVNRDNIFNLIDRKKKSLISSIDSNKFYYHGDNDIKEMEELYNKCKQEMQF